MLSPRHSILGSVTLCLTGLCLFSGCGESSGRYPNEDPQTKARIDAIHREAEIEMDQAKNELAKTEQNLDFRAKQAKDKSERERAKADLEHDKTVQPWRAQIDNAQKSAANDRARVKADSDAMLKNGGNDQADTIAKDSANRITRIDRDVNDNVADLQQKIAKEDAAMQQHRVDIQADENKAMAEIAKDRTAAQNTFREKKIDIEGKTAKNLNDAGSNTDRKSAQ